MKSEQSGLVGNLVGVIVLPETQEEWLEYCDQKVAEEVNKVLDRIEEVNVLTKTIGNTTEYIDDSYPVACKIQELRQQYKEVR